MPDELELELELLLDPEDDELLLDELLDDELEEARVVLVAVEIELLEDDDDDDELLAALDADADPEDPLALAALVDPAEVEAAELAATVAAADEDAEEVAEALDEWLVDVDEAPPSGLGLLLPKKHPLRKTSIATDATIARCRMSAPEPEGDHRRCKARWPQHPSTCPASRGQ